MVILLAKKFGLGMARCWTVQALLSPYPA